MRADIMRNNAGNQGSLTLRSLDDPRKIVGRGIPIAVQQEPFQLAATARATRQLSRVELACLR